VSHNALSDDGLSLSNRSRNEGGGCRTQVSHRSLSGVWRRGAMYQYRVRVPADLRQVIGSSHINRSLGTASLAVARRSAKVMAYQIDRSFEEARNSGAWNAASALPPLHVAEVAASSTTADHGLTLGIVVERYLTDATISRSPKSQIVYPRRSRSGSAWSVGLSSPRRQIPAGVSTGPCGDSQTEPCSRSHLSSDFRLPPVVYNCSPL
jgi:hypothetical protein